MKKFGFLLLSVILVASMVGTAGASLVTNGDFELGLTGWTPGGDGDVQAAIANDILTLQGMDNKFALFGANSSAGRHELSQTFTAPATDGFTVSFNWAFDFVDDNLFNSDIFASVIAPTGVIPIQMQDLNSGLLGIALTNDFFQQTFAIPGGFGGGDVRIEFNLFEQLDGATGSTFSIAGIDNVSVIAADAPVVPIPSTLLLLGTGLVSLIGIGRRKMMKS